MAEGQGTREPMLSAIWTARVINEALGGPFVTPWEVGELPEEWIEAIVGMKVRVAQLREGKQRVEEAKERWRKRINHELH